ncbi:MAG: hypothetical protein ACE5OP_01750 [Candidatus Glassbacteria bacterium]
MSAKTQQQLTGSQKAEVGRHRDFSVYPIYEIDSPGCYISNQSGNLFRVTPEMLSIGGTVFTNFVSRDPWYFTKLTDDYLMPLDEVRILAANANLRPNF